MSRAPAAGSLRIRIPCWYLLETVKVQAPCVCGQQVSWNHRRRPGDRLLVNFVSYKSLGQVTAEKSQTPMFIPFKSSKPSLRIGLAYLGKSVKNEEINEPVRTGYSHDKVYHMHYVEELSGYWRQNQRSGGWGGLQMPFPRTSFYREGSRAFAMVTLLMTLSSPVWYGTSQLW